MKQTVSSENLLQSVDALLNLPSGQKDPSIDDGSQQGGYDTEGTTFPYGVPVEQEKPRKPQIPASVIVRSASALLNVFSVLSSENEKQDPHATPPREFTLNRNGLELRVSSELALEKCSKTLN